MVRKVVRALVGNYCATVNCIIAPTITIQNDIRSCAIDTQIEVIPSGLQQRFIPENQPSKKRDVRDPFKLLVVSRFVPEKNIKVVIDLFTRLDSRYTLTLIGYGPLFEPLKEYAYTQLELSAERVIFVHKPAQELIADAYLRADLFLFSSLTDVQPLALVESMAAGTPIIALAGHGRENIKNGYNGFIVDTVDEMYATINQIADAPALHGILQDGAWQMAQEYMPQKSTQKLVAVYEKLLGIQN
jgi:glycosyltransferase involved in cell wall biosynthesis